jgi:hypothetical protein
MAGDRCIQVSYRAWSAIAKRARMFRKSAVPDVAHICKTGHVFRFVFAEKFLALEDPRIL